MKNKKQKSWDVNSPMDVMQSFNEIHKKKVTKAYDDMHKYHLSKKTNKEVYISTKELCLANNDFSKVLSKIKTITNADANLDGDERVQNWIEMAANNNLLAGTRLFGAWRNTATVYEIDEAMADQAMKAKICPETPSNIFKNLPEWAVYMKLPKPINYDPVLYKNSVLLGSNKDDQDQVKERQIIGFWATHDQIQTVYGTETILEIYYHLSFDNVEEFHSYPMVAARVAISDDLTVEQSLDSYYGELDSRYASDEFLEPLEVILSLLLWLCVEEPDVSNIKDIPLNRAELKKSKLIKSKLTGKFVAPMQETHLTIAKRMGGEVREWNKQIESAKQQGLPKRRIPHIRRGHWNGVWTGSGDNKVYKTYWQKPVFVNECRPRLD